MDELCRELYPRVQSIVHRSLAKSLRPSRPWLGAVFSTGDIVQEIFIGVLRGLDDVRGKGEEALLHYIATLTRNRLIDAIRFYEATRRDRRRHDASASKIKRVAEDAHDPQEHAMLADEIARFHEALTSFNERDRTLLRERLEHERPFGELAAMLGYASADSARKAFHVAQAKLVLRLRKQP